MSGSEFLNTTSWDAESFNMPTYELVEYTSEALQQALKTVGHHTVKVDPLADKRLLHESGFYYCDTLIAPFCNATSLNAFSHPYARISKIFDENHLMLICDGAFSHGRFHRDFLLNAASADLRYNRWMRQLVAERNVYGLYWQDDLAGFVGYKDNSLVLHAVAKSFRGQGLAKYWWSEVCLAMFSNGHKSIQSSISASNLAAINLYSSLGFSFKTSLDVYHRIVN